MKVAINAWFINQINTGSGQYLRYLVPAMSKLSPQVEFCLIAPESALQQADPNIDWGENVSLHGVTLTVSNLNKVRFEQAIFPKMAVELGANVAHVPYFGSALNPRLPTVVTIHDLIPMVLPEYRGGALVRLYTSLVASAAQNAAIILADSDASRRDILQQLNLPADRVRTVLLAPAPHYQPLEDWEPILAVEEKYNLPEKFALYMGGFDVRKNLQALMYAWTYVATGLGDNLTLVLAGKLPDQETDFFPDPLRMARELAIESHVQAVGWIDEADKPALYNAARVFVYPSRYEGFGLPVLEAMACGTPVVASNAASLPELTGSHAFLADPSDTKMLASPIITLSIEEETYEEMSTRAYQQAQQFSWQQTAFQTLQAYRDALS